MNYFKNILFFFLLAFNTFGQENLILNGDFEEYWTCPDDLTQIEKCKYVYSPCLVQSTLIVCTADYFNRCAAQSDGCSMPNNAFGYQEARSGNGYIGLSNADIFGNYKEYIQLSFSKKLDAYATYEFTIYVNLAQRSGYTSSLLHFKFTDTLIDYSILLSDLLIPDVRLDNLTIDDTLNWKKISFQFKAEGNEKYMIFGNFNINSSSDSYYLFNGDPLSFGYAYFYFDDASLRLIKEAEPITFPNVFTPNNDGINDEFNILTGQEHFNNLTIINRWGNIVYYSDTSSIWNGKDMNGNDLPEGVYFAFAKSKIIIEGKQEQYHGMVHLIR